jgi:hypothetical protein
MRRNFLIGTLGTLAAAILSCSATTALAQAPKVIKISHQFPGGTIDEGDFRDRLTRKFAAESRSGPRVRSSSRSIRPHR